jgi:uncharacterized phage-associated protein
MSSFDPRAVCNVILDKADSIEVRITHLAVQKLLYFCHGMFLLTQGRPLVSGYFEAWKHGPVHPVVYEAFKECGSSYIQIRAQKFNLVSQTHHVIPKIDDPECNLIVDKVVNCYGRLPAGHLVELSHAPGAPWAYVVENSTKKPMLGLRITDSVIRKNFKFHKISVGDAILHGEGYEDAPFA